MKSLIFASMLLLMMPLAGACQHESHPSSSTLKVITDVEPQPLLAQAIRLNDALSFLGSSLSDADSRKLKALQDKPFTAETVKQVQNVLDPYCLAMVSINPEARVKVERGPARAGLMQDGWTSFLIKIHNEAGISPQLEVQSPNAAPVLHRSTSAAKADPKNKLTPGQVANRFLEMQMYRQRPLHANLSGLKLEYSVLQVYSKDAGQREAEIGFNIGQGSQDIGFRNTINILFNIKPSVKVKFRIKDDDGSPAMASFIIRDGIERILSDTAQDLDKIDYRLYLAQLQFWERATSKELRGIYPLPSRRVAAYDQYPDFFFQPQVYRYDGEFVKLPPGKYHITYTRGPEYLSQTKELVVPAGVDSVETTFQLKRWVNMSKLQWYSGDHHIHAAGCSHYESPEEGVPPLDMWRQILGEDLNVAAVLTWGPSWYHQKGFFTGNVDTLSTKKNIMRYDVEVSGFPSSHAGHIVLLRLKEDDYPGTTTIEEWPSWTLPVLKWAQGQQGLTGYAHSGWGLEPQSPTKDLPNYIIPKMDGIGANEYVVTVAHNAVDFYSLGDTPAPWELNMWYHALNCGFRTRLSGETDFPCIFDERVGQARSYFKSNGNLDYEQYAKALKEGNSYVSDGNSHIIDFSVNGVSPGMSNSEVKLSGANELNITANVAAYLQAQQTEYGTEIASRAVHDQPYWSIERARIDKSRQVPVELLVNGVPVDTITIEADGKWNPLHFAYVIKKSCWVALRIYPSAHTNPVFIAVDNKPINVKKSAEWCRSTVDQCWKMKQPNIREKERPAAEAAYNEARKIYDEKIRTANTD